MRSSVWTLLVIGGILFSLGRWVWQRPWVSAIGPRLVIGREPLQEVLAAPLSKLFHEDKDISRLELTHRFDITGEAIAVTSYRWAFANPYYEVDLGLAWGPKVESYKKRLNFYQGARWLMWSARESLTPEMLADMQTHIGNLHLIPAAGKPTVDKAIHWIRKGDHVRLRGYLVRIVGPSGEVVVTSSTSRDDTGNGACEVMWVDEVQIDQSIYR